jgi:hypothetical protein
MAQAALGWLATADVVSLTTAEQADCLRALEHVSALHTAAGARVLHAFHTRGGCEDDGHGSTRTWLRWQTQLTGGAAGAAIGWMRRLTAHPAVRDALAAAQISESWARQICDWTGQLPGDARAGADVILLGAAAGGAELRDLETLAEQIRQCTARPDADGDDGFGDRSLALGTTFRGAGKLRGDLTPQCTAALSAVLEALGKRAGPEDLRSRWQRDHDALEEACRRLIASGCLPERAGQPTQIQLHMTLGQLRGLDGADVAEAAWAGPMAGPGAGCDASIVPVVTGHVDPGVLDRLAAALLTGKPAQPGAPRDAAARRRERAEADRQARAVRAARQIMIKAAADLLSGPGGLAAYLRTRLTPGIVASVSLPLDVGAVTETIPVHLRRAVTARDRHCRWPGCPQPAAACQPHHIIPRSRGGPASLANLALLCTFHHLIAIHRWGWSIVLLPDGSVTVTSPDGRRTYHGHGPPTPAAA